MEGSGVIFRTKQACAQACLLSERSRELIEMARLVRMDAIRRRESCLSPRAASSAPQPVRETGGLSSFRVDGTVGDQPVEAVYEGGNLRCDPLLRSHAALVVSLEESFRLGEEDVPATLNGPPALVLATLMRAMRVRSVRATLPAPPARPT
jgi:hypothetical protein